MSKLSLLKSSLSFFVTDEKTNVNYRIDCTALSGTVSCLSGLHNWLCEFICLNDLSLNIPSFNISCTSYYELRSSCFKQLQNFIN